MVANRHTFSALLAPLQLDMDIKHQVFVSSTYRDLLEHRKAVIHALLELDCIPAGMELFPAADEDAWTLIKEVIDGCDYYVLILAGKYGTVGPAGVSYTEMEFDYAVSQSKPIITFLHESPESLPSTATERTEVLQQKLATFREKARVKHCKFWTSPEDLGGKISRSLVQLRKRHPSPGWVRGEFALNGSLMQELQELRLKVKNLEQQVAVEGIDEEQSQTLSQGEDLAELTVVVDRDDKKDLVKVAKVKWNWLIKYFGPMMLHECTDEELSERSKLAIYHWMDHKKSIRPMPLLDKFIIPYVTEDQIRIQFQALGYIAPGIKKRAVSDTKKYWRLTPRGERAMVLACAERRKKPDDASLAEDNSN